MVLIAERPYNCAHCVMNFTSKQSLQMHKKLHDANWIHKSALRRNLQIKIDCDYFGIFTHRKDDALRHIRTHKLGFKKCCHCREKVVTWDLKNHYQTHSGKFCLPFRIKTLTNFFYSSRTAIRLHCKKLLHEFHIIEVFATTKI